MGIREYVKYENKGRIKNESRISRPNYLDEWICYFLRQERVPSISTYRKKEDTEVI